MTTVLFTGATMGITQGQPKEGLIAGHQYQIGKLITTGGTGAVYACRDIHANNSGLVLKMIPSLSLGPECTHDMSLELSLMQQLRHPNLVRTLDFGVMEGSGELFLVEERLNGVELFSATEGMSSEEVLSMMIELLKGLRYLHARGIIHGGLNPSRIIVCDGAMEERNERLKLIDFNQKCRPDPSRQSIGCGTLSYTAPEILLGDREDARSDLYATGVLLYQLLTRRLPFEDEDPGFLTQKQLQGRVDMRAIETLEKGRSISGVLNGLLEKDPAVRMPSADDAIAALNRILGKKNSDADEKEMECHFTAARLVGRETELSFLHERVRMVKECGRGNVAFISGEAGSGKSRVMAELRSMAVFDGIRVVEATCGEESPYSPYRQILDKVSHHGATIFRFDRVPRIAEADPFDSSSGFAAGQFHDLLTRELLRRLSRRPTLLLIHDFHWADKATCMVLDYVCADIQAFPVCLCVSLRHGENRDGDISGVMARTAGSEHVEILALEPLTRENIKQMVVGMTGDRGLRESLGDWIFRTVGGNPFFLEEMLKHLVEQGILKRASGEWKFIEDRLVDLDAPAGVGAVLKKRLSNLSTSAQALLNWLALFRRIVPKETMCRVMSVRPEEMAEILTELCQRQMVRIETIKNMQMVEFNHDLIAEIIRGNLPKGRARRMHRKIAEVIEVESGTESHLHELATHHMEGKTGEPSIRFALASAARSRAEFSHENALRCYDYVFRTRNRLSGEDLCTAAIEASDTMFALGMAGNAIDLLKKILIKSRGNQTALQARIFMQLALAYQHSGNLRMQERCCKTGLNLLGRHRDGNPDLTRAMLLAELAFGAVIQSRPLRGVRYLEKALDACPEQNATALKGRIQNLFASLFRVACKFHDALGAAERATAILPSSGESYLSCSAFSTLGFILMGLGRFSLALEKHKHAVELSAKNRSVILRSQALGNLAECLCRMGRVSEAFIAVEQAVKSVSDSNNPAIRHAFNAILAETKLASGDYAGARRILMDMERNDGNKSSLFTFGHACYIGADLNFTLGNFQEALKYVDLIRRHESAEAPFYERELAEAIEARILSLRGSVEQSLNRLLSLDRNVARKRWPYHRCIIQMHIGEMYAEQNRLAKAERYARNAHRLALAMRSMPLMRRARLLLGLIYSPLRQSAFQLEDTNRSAVSENERMTPASRAIEELQQSLRTGELSCPSESWRATAELALIHDLLGDTASSVDYARKAYEGLCKLEDHIPSEMLPVFYGAFERSRIKLDLVRLIDMGGTARAGRKRNAVKTYDDTNSRILLRLSSTVNSVRELRPLLESVLDQLIPVLDVGRAWIFLKDGEEKSFSPALGRNASQETLAAPERVCSGILEAVCGNGGPLISADTAKDSRIGKEFSSVSLPGKLFCAPLKVSDRIIGGIYADNPNAAENLSEQVINLFAAFCNLSAMAIENVRSCRGDERKSERNVTRNQRQDPYAEIVGKSASVERLKERIGLASSSPLDILITGDSGTGKELVARAIHRTGRRQSGKFIPVDCGSFSDNLAESEFFGYRKGAFTGASENRQGLLEASNGGILFLDEISNMPLPLQAKLLRVLQEREVRRIGELHTRKVDIQVIAATNKDLMEGIRNGGFRRDLYYRLNAMEIRVPPLRERSDDIPLLVDWFLEKTAEHEGGKYKRLQPEALERLKSYSYPGNIRELKNIMAGAYYSTKSGTIGPDELPPEVRGEGFDEPGESFAAAGIYRDIIEGRGTFDELVKEPFLKHQFGVSFVREIIRTALKDAGGRYRDAFFRLRIPDGRYASTIQLLKRHDCYHDFRPFRRNRQ
jgi:transcriptional regulator with GAF, ATPase, and Fis domain/serine/threonine protein kinase/tetratricopeptide (TPR) repeat protein